MDELWNGEVRINKDILKYKEHLFLGLSIKQTVFGGLAIVVSLIIFALFSKTLGKLLTILLIASAAAPIAAFGFLSYNGMSFGQLITAIIKHFATKSDLYFKSRSFYSRIIYIYKSNKKQRKDYNHAQDLQTDETS